MSETEVFPVPQRLLLYMGERAGMRQFENNFFEAG